MDITFPDYLKCRWPTKVTRLETFSGPAHNQHLDVFFVSIPIPRVLHKIMRRDTIIKKAAKFRDRLSRTEEVFYQRSGQKQVHMKKS